MSTAPTQPDILPVLLIEDEPAVMACVRAALERSGYAVGYFECWNLESLQGVIDAAEMVSAPGTWPRLD